MGTTGPHTSPTARGEGPTTTPRSCTTASSEPSPLGFRSDRRDCRRETSTGSPGCTERFRQPLRSRRTPRGLLILVDGQSVTTPAQFDWNPGSTHTVQAVSPQTVGAERFVFGRWSDEGGARRTLTADAESTWFEANYIAQRQDPVVRRNARGRRRDGPSRIPGTASTCRGSRSKSRREGAVFRNFLQWNPIPDLPRGRGPAQAEGPPREPRRIPLQAPLRDGRAGPRVTPRSPNSPPHTRRSPFS